ncbi:hypothetical protein ABZS83_32485 [Streptomyces sp. NPDC005426]|uniref:hypothetical protein n=1 Tax=Streptomyces sp. NPDC005426 TaxID=3155344 RepID=UPI0033B8D8B8
MGRPARSRSSSLRTTAFTLASVVLFGSGCAGGKDQPERAAPVAVSAKAPQLRGEDVDGRDAESGGRPVLLAFLRPTADNGSKELAAARSSAVVAQSMATQYGANGLRVVIADTAGTKADADALINLAYDWHLDGVQLLTAEAAGEATAQYGVATTPTTYLIGPDGTVLQRWDSTLSAQAVGPAVQHAIEGS